MDVRATEVFTPSDFPAYTYVARNDSILESRLKDALATPGEIVSLSGPSKSGKTVLIEKVVGNDNLICVTGSSLRNADDLWNRVLDQLDEASQTVVAESTTTGVEASGKLAATLGGWLAGVTSEASTGTSRETGTSAQRTLARRGIHQVINLLSDSTSVLLIDDFHYMPRDVQTTIAREIKEAARQGVKICTASVPHRSDDVVRANPELRGRVRAIDSTYWDVDSLLEIPALGFELLNITIDESTLRIFAEESSGSPQLMQCLCLDLCFALKVHETQISRNDFEVNARLRAEVMEEVTTRSDFSSLVRACHGGPRTRGRTRSAFPFIDGTQGDVYRAVLLAVAAAPPSLAFPPSEMSARIARVCKGEIPTTSSVYQACEQIARIALSQYPDQRIIEWDTDSKLLDVVDPYLLFYVRWSQKLKQLGLSHT